MLEAIITFPAGRIPSGNLALAISSTMRFHIENSQAANLLDWCREQGFTVQFNSVWPSTIEQIGKEIAAHIESGAWKP